ncbi:hypothetical protein C8R43DRAFT_934831 [Mycena crocata]|nr:hypothetical protein C8R43DRAFT_934831 [Mycena crocata]
MSSYVVTGAAKGLGLEFVTQLSANQENTVFALVRNEATATELKNLPGKNITVLQADITDTKALKKAAEAVSKITGGKLDYLINNAGSLNSDDVPGFSGFKSEEALENVLLDTFKINTIGTIHCTNTFLPLLRKGTIKKVISISSAHGDMDVVLQAGLHECPGYALSKAALNLAVAKYAVELKPEGFVFLSLSPGAVDTPGANQLAPQHMEAVMAMAAKFPRIAPDFKGPISAEESVKLQLEVIYRWKIEDTGAFVSQFGNKQWL